MNDSTGDGDLQSLQTTGGNSSASSLRSLIAILESERHVSCTNQGPASGFAFTFHRPAPPFAWRCDRKRSAFRVNLGSAIPLWTCLPEDCHEGEHRLSKAHFANAMEENLERDKQWDPSCDKDKRDHFPFVFQAGSISSGALSGGRRPGTGQSRQTSPPERLQLRCLMHPYPHRD